MANYSLKEVRDDHTWNEKSTEIIAENFSSMGKDFKIQISKIYRMPTMMGEKTSHNTS